MTMRLVDKAIESLRGIESHEIYGRVTKVLGLLVEITGFGDHLAVGSMVYLTPKNAPRVPCEVIGFRDEKALLLPFGTLEGVGLDCPAVIQQSEPAIYPHDQWLGRVINALGQPIDGKGPIMQGTQAIPLRNKPPPPHDRQRIGGVLDLGVRAVNNFTPVCLGQRMGIFAGSGVGKSVLLSMMAKYTQADISVIGLVGERGREVQEFLEDDLGELGLKRSVVIVATGDEPALMRKQAAYMTMAVSEYFRDKGLNVLCLMDSVTRFAMAQREIGLSAGEPPTSKGYPPTTFGELARLLERAGPGAVGQGTITGIFSVLVEGDDHNEPISDSVRGIIDGHIMMERRIADRGRYPAINILKSISRSMPKCFDDQQNALVAKTKKLISRYEDMEELIKLGAYRKGSDPEVDEAILRYPHLEDFLGQDKEECTPNEEGFAMLGSCLGVSYKSGNSA